jgi:hypothetical protein
VAKSKAKAAPANTHPPELSEVDGLKAEVERLTRELRAHQERESREKEAAGHVRAAEHNLNGCKQATSAAKERLAEANAALAAIVMGDAQTSFIEKKPGKDGDEPSNEAERRWLGCRQVDDEKAGVSFDQIEAACHDVRALAPTEKPLQVATVNLFGGELPYMVVEQFDTAGFTCFACLSLVTKDEWQQLFEEKYGRCVEGFDQSDEAKDQRQRGGPDCGRVVKAGRKKLVVGPKEQALIVCFETVETDEPPADEPEQLSIDEDESDD